jgi:hypothetical protein
MDTAIVLLVVCFCIILILSLGVSSTSNLGYFYNKPKPIYTSSENLGYEYKPTDIPPTKPATAPTTLTAPTIPVTSITPTTLTTPTTPAPTTPAPATPAPTTPTSPTRETVVPEYNNEPVIVIPTKPLPAYIMDKPVPVDKRFLLSIPSPIRNQGPNSNSCNSTSVCYLLDYHYKQKFNKNYFFSAQYLYWATRVLENIFPKNEGTSNPFAALKQYGIVLDKHFTYDSNANACDCKKYEVTPKQEIIDIGKRNIPKFTTFTVSKNNFDDIKRAIYYNGPLVCSIDEYTNIDLKNPNIKNPGPNDKYKIGHALTIWGWDDDKRYWIVVNTFGDKLGDKGLYYLDYDYRYIYDCIGLQLYDNCPDFNQYDLNYVNKNDWICGKYLDDINIHCPYVNTVQRGVECYWSPPDGYDWTTPGGLLIGKTCPEGTNDSGTTCWYDRGVGRIPDKKDCDPGERDTGATCWVDSYGRGVGRDADWEPCGDNSYDVLGTCWKHNYQTSWGSVGCTGGRPFRFEGYHDCYTNDFPYVYKNIGDRARTCREDEDKNGVRCYPKCSPGFHPVGCCLCEPDGGNTRKWLKDRQFCREDEELKDGLCYKKPRDGFTCDVTHCKFSKDVKVGNKEGLVRKCP